MGDFIGATGSFIQAKTDYNASKYNAQLARQNATWERQATEEKAKQANVQGRQAIGSMRASYGISGVTLEGSAFDVLEQSALAVKQDELNIKVAGERRVLALEQGATIEEYQGRAARTLGNIKGYAGIAQGGEKAVMKAKGGGA